MKPEAEPLKVLTPQAAGGRKGGLETVRRHGAAHMKKLGSLGGSATARRHGRSHFQRIGGLHARKPAALPVPPAEAAMLAKATGGAVKSGALPAAGKAVTGAALPGGKGEVLK